MPAPGGFDRRKTPPPRREWSLPAPAGSDQTPRVYPSPSRCLQVRGVVLLTCASPPRRGRRRGGRSPETLGVCRSDETSPSLFSLVLFASLVETRSSTVGPMDDRLEGGRPEGRVVGTGGAEEAAGAKAPVGGQGKAEQGCQLLGPHELLSLSLRWLPELLPARSLARSLARPPARSLALLSPLLPRRLHPLLLLGD